MKLIRTPKMKSDDKAVKRFCLYRDLDPESDYVVTMHKWNKVSTEKKYMGYKPYNRVTWTRYVRIITPRGEVFTTVYQTYNGHFSTYRNGYSAWDGMKDVPDQKCFVTKSDNEVWRQLFIKKSHNGFGTREDCTVAILHCAANFIRTLEREEE